MPVTYVSFFDTLRFANWMNNGQGSASTETGAYTLLGGTTLPSNWATVTRNADAKVVLTSENECYKAAYYDPTTTSYFDFPTRSNADTVCSAPTSTANRANCGSAVGGLTVKGSYTGSASPYGTFDQGGNAFEWNEAFGSGLQRVWPGGTFSSGAPGLAAYSRYDVVSSDECDGVGFRVAATPEPSTGLLGVVG
jgi:sulfatase modifying factor 1